MEVIVLSIYLLLVLTYLFMQFRDRKKSFIPRTRNYISNISIVLSIGTFFLSLIFIYFLERYNESVFILVISSLAFVVFYRYKQISFKGWLIIKYVYTALIIFNLFYAFIQRFIE